VEISGEIVSKFDDVRKDAALLIEEYKSGGSIITISKRYEVGVTFIRKILGKSGLVLRSKADSNRVRYGYTIDETAFSEFKTEESSYFLGLILADGCVDSRGRFSITLNQKDSYMLIRLQKYMGMDYGYMEGSIFDKRTNNTYYRATLATSNHSVVQNLRKQNIEPNKSTIEKLPNIDWINDRHFWRGVVDGDGHLNMNKTKASVIVLVGSSEVIQGFIDFCSNTVGLKVPRVPKGTQYKNKVLYKVQLNNEDARNVAKYLYEDSTVYLDRKYDQMLKLK